MRLSDFRNEVRQRLGDTEGVLVLDHDLNLWVNLAVRTIWRSWPWTFARSQSTVSTADGAATVNLPADCQRVTKVIDTVRQVPLVSVPDTLLQDEYETTDTGRPEYFTDGGLDTTVITAAPVRRLRLYPTPDGVYSLKVTYLALPRAMAGEDEFSPLPEDFDEAVVSWALVRYYRKVEDLQQAAEHNQAFNAELGRLVEVYGSIQAGEYPTVPSSEGGGGRPIIRRSYGV